jgi:hypothetical protein
MFVVPPKNLGFQPQFEVQIASLEECVSEAVLPAQAYSISISLSLGYLKLIDFVRIPSLS